MNVLVLNREGAGQRLAVLEPFFRTILPAVKQKADEITMSTNLSDSSEVSLEARKGSQTSQLSPDPEFHPLISSSRLRILSGMSIMPSESVQHGKVYVDIDDQQITLNLTVRVEQGKEIVTVHSTILDIEHAKRLIRDDAAGLVAWMWASIMFTKPENREKVTIEDLLACLKRRGSPAAGSAIVLYQLTGRPGGREPRTFSSDCEDWRDYLSKSGFL